MKLISTEKTNPELFYSIQIGPTIPEIFIFKYIKTGFKHIYWHFHVNGPNRFGAHIEYNIVLCYLNKEEPTPSIHI